MERTKEGKLYMQCSLPIKNTKSHYFIFREDLPKLKYLTMCIKESMRCHCPVPFIERELTNDLVIDGITLPKGSVVDIQIYNLHHNPVVWDEPMVVYFLSNFTVFIHLFSI